MDSFREVIVSAEIQMFPQQVEAAPPVAQVLPVPSCSGTVRDARAG